MLSKQAWLAIAAVTGFALGGPLFGRFLGGLPIVGGVALGPGVASGAAAITAFQIAKRFGKWKDPGGAIKMAFIRAWRNKQMKRLNWTNSAKPHQGAKECERRRRGVGHHARSIRGRARHGRVRQYRHGRRSGRVAALGSDRLGALAARDRRHAARWRPWPLDRRRPAWPRGCRGNPRQFRSRS